MKDLALWKFAGDNLQNGRLVVLLVVLHSSGSSPGRQGFKMAVNNLGEMAGSIGGGIMEHKLVELARKMLQGNQVHPILKRQIHSKAAPQNQSGMICSGEQTVAIYLLNSEKLAVIEKLIQATKKEITGLLKLTQEGLKFLDYAEQDSRCTFLAENATVWEYSEKLPARDAVYIIGGGHVALAFSKVLSLLDFEVHLFDDRPGLNTFDENAFVRSKTITPYSEIAGFIPEDDQSYVVIMTFGYRSDKEALCKLLGRNFRYLGLMGSQAKIDQLFAELRKEGFAEEDLQKVYAPIGIPISSKTPEEIAISIAAQIIKVRNS